MSSRFPEQPDEDFQKIAPLRRQGCELAIGHKQAVSHGEHVDERPADGVVVPVDLGQDFEGLPRNGEDADDLLRLQAAVDAGQNGRLVAESPAGAFGEGA